MCYLQRNDGFVSSRFIVKKLQNKTNHDVGIGKAVECIGVVGNLVGGEQHHCAEVPVLRALHGTEVQQAVAAVPRLLVTP